MPDDEGEAAALLDATSNARTLARVSPHWAKTIT